MFEKAKWIWLAEGQSEDSYAEFRDTFTYGTGKAEITLSADTDYTLYVNGEYAASGQYGDFEHYKIYDTVDITEYLRDGENRIDILVYYCGVATSRYRVAAAGLIYETRVDGEPVACSSEKTLSRISPTYACGIKRLVSGQLGFGFDYDAAKENDGGFVPSVSVAKSCEFFTRPIKKHKICERREMKTLTKIDDTHYLVDLGGECVGLPTLDIFSESEQTLTVAWGEHIVDGGVRKIIGNRSFFYRYGTASGQNIFTNYMLRLGCRYIEVFAENPIKVNYIGLLPQVYETTTVPVHVEGELEKRIYDVCVNTLKLCMMEHYVDCPWREQALYAFDSRNQMLCGYYGFEDGNAEYARANLKLIGEDRRSDGLLSICYPCGTALAIPSFSLYWLLSMKEYVDHTGDVSLAAEMLPKMRGILDEFIKNSRDGLVYTFEGANMWNFYDWSDYSSGSLGKSGAVEADLVINCLFVAALECFESVCGSVGAEFGYKGLAEELRRRIRGEFLTENGIFTMRRGKEQYTVLGNSLAVLSGTATGAEAEKICEALVGGELVDSSLSMKIFEYEALLNTDTERYRDFVLGDIAKNYKPMLDFGSDTVWETAKGESDFRNAGSLCHGWSAVPVYIYHRLGVAKRSAREIVK